MILVPWNITNSKSKLFRNGSSKITGMRPYIYMCIYIYMIPSCSPFPIFNWIMRRIYLRKMTKPHPPRCLSLERIGLRLTFRDWALCIHDSCSVPKCSPYELMVAIAMYTERKKSSWIGKIDSHPPSRKRVYYWANHSLVQQVARWYSYWRNRNY